MFGVAAKHLPVKLVLTGDFHVGRNYSQHLLVDINSRWVEKSLRLCVALAKVGQGGAARNYFGSFVRIESPLFRNGSRVRQVNDALSSRPPVAPVGPVAITVPPLVGTSI